MYEFIITEKPSAAKKIAEALADGKPVKEMNEKVAYYKVTHKGKDLVIGCAVGHLYTVAEKEKSFKYPVFDLEWKPTHDVDKHNTFSKKYVNTLKKIAKDAKSFTVACDYDIEGEVIGMNIVKYICKQKDAARMKFSTLTKPDLIKSYANKNKTLDWGQAEAGETRHYLDWMYGINLSRALTTAIKKTGSFKVLSIGRVQGPALQLVVEKEKEIRAFKPEPYWELQLLGKLKKENIEAWHEKDKFWKESEAKAVLQKTKGKQGIVESVEKKQHEQSPPNPFDLTTLQTEAYSVLRITPKDALAIAQNLYLEGLISYPRTSSQKLPPEINYKNIFNGLAKYPEYKPLADALLKTSLKPNEGAKTDPAHPAIFPTGVVAKNLRDRDKRIYDLIVRRFLACFAEPAQRETVTIKIDVNKEIFVAKGSRTIKEGWQLYYKPYVKVEEQTMPETKKGDAVAVEKIVKHDKQTTPPKRYTPASIIKELEKRNLGTKATRASIIDTLYQRNYVTGDSIEATEMGIQTIAILEKYLPDIIDEALTRHFEDEMEEIREKKLTEKQVLDEAKKELIKILDKFQKKEKEIGKELQASYKESLENESQLGKCPKCKDGMLKIMYSKKIKKKFVACNNYPKCKTIFNIPQNGIKATDKVCEKDNYPMVLVGMGRGTRRICLNPSCETKRINDKEVRKEMDEVKKGIVEKECPKCKGNLVVRRSVYGEFYGCSNFPKCRHTEKIQDGPVKEDFKKGKV
ncbi:DNA topoisomerase I [Candidatus Woesearchaeota archaeon]|nr:MAG: DNA topoisomerase I [Candidatus Woesearchaeota archaeon]